MAGGPSRITGGSDIRTRSDGPGCTVVDGGTHSMTGGMHLGGWCEAIDPYQLG